MPKGSSKKPRRNKSEDEAQAAVRVMETIAAKSEADDVPEIGDVDYAEEIKVYASSGPQPGMSPNAAASRYSPGRVKSVERIPRIGQPLDKFISTSYMERWNLTLRMQNRRFTRLTNGFSKKFENHQHMLALTMVYYNFCRKHRSLNGQTPAMAAHLTDYVWTASDLLALDMWTAAKAA